MAFDGITAQLLSEELNSELSNGRIDKVFQPDKHTIILHIRANGSIKKLLISISPSAPRINITNTTRENPQMPPSFCMLLRKYIAGGRIISVNNPGYERIIDISISTTDELHDTKEIRLIAELMGRYSNLILVNQSGKIIDSCIHVDFSVNRVREVMPARIYEYPPSQTEKNTADKCLALINSNSLPVIDSEAGRPISKALLNSCLGMSPSLVRQICIDADVDERTPYKSLTDSDKNSLINACAKLFGQIVNRNYSPAVYFTDDEQTGEFSPFGMTGFDECITTSTISDAIDLYYDKKEKNIDLERKRNTLNTKINNALTHVVHKAEIHKQDYEEGLKSDYYKKCGDLILAYTYLIEGRPESFVCQDYYEDPPKDIRIKLNPTLNPSDNAQEYYKKFRKSKRKLQLSEKYIENDKLAVEYFRTLKAAAAACDCEEDIEALDKELLLLAGEPKEKVKKENINPNNTVGKAKSGKASSRALREAAKRATLKQNANSKKHKEKALPVRTYITSDGHTILCGRNNIQNEELTLHTASKDDWWFHIKGMPGTHVILKKWANEDIPSDSSVIEAAQTAAYFSRSIMIEEHNYIADSNGKEIKAEVDYCPVSHVKKIPSSNPGMVIYEGYYSIIVAAKEPEKKVQE